MHYFCPSCWKEVAPTKLVCPYCGIDIVRYESSADFVDKLLSAINHFEAETRLRAISILGERKEIKAVPRLMDIVHQNEDPFLIEASLEALFKIGGKEYSDIFKEALRNRFYIVSEKARRLLDSIRQEPSRANN